MAIEKRELGTQNDPDVIVQGNAIEVFPEPSRQDQIKEAAEILVNEEGVLVGEEMMEEVPEVNAAPFDANLVN